MNFIIQLQVEFKRIFQSRITWLCLFAMPLLSAAGYWYYYPAGTLTKTSKWIANPSLSGAFLGAVLFGLLTLYEEDRIRRHSMDTLSNAVVSPLSSAIRRSLVMGAASLAGSATAALICLPYSWFQMKHAFMPDLYVISFLLILFFSLLFGSLLASSFYHITQRVDLSCLLLLVCILLSFSKYASDHYLLRWVNPLVPLLSDDFSNALVFRLIGYNRLFWLLLLLALYSLSLLCIRRYERTLPGSFLHNIRKPGILLLSVILLITGTYAGKAQPYVDHSPMTPVFADIIYSPKGRLKQITGDVTLNAKAGTLRGTATYQLNTKQAFACEMELAAGIQPTSIQLNGSKIPYQIVHPEIDKIYNIKFDLPKGNDLTVTIEFEGFPKIWSYLRSYLMDDIISTKYINLSKSTLLPNIMIESAQSYSGVTLNLTLPSGMTVITTGDTTDKITENPGQTANWLLVSSQSRSFTLYAANYTKHQFEESDMTIDFYYSQNHEETMQKLDAINTIQEVIRYCASHYGSLQYDKSSPLNLIQETAFVPGGGAFGNFSVMGETTFSEENLLDPARGASGSEVLAHEIVHQWWGLTWMFEDKGDWSSEGMTCYTTYRFMKQLKGEDYASQYYVKEWEKQVDNLNRSYYHRHPEALSLLPEKYAILVNDMDYSTSRYAIMPLKIKKAAELIGGEEQMDQILAKLFKSGGAHPETRTITYQDFLDACGLTEEELTID